MKKWNLIVDVANCTNCNLCALAVQDEHVDNQFPGYAEAMPKHGHRWINIERHERGTPPVTDVAYIPMMCQHCDNAPCMTAAPDVIRKRDDGIVIIDPEKSRGRRDIVDTCPYGAIWWNQEKQLPQHWIFDAHLLDAGWDEPRCVTVCATNALKAIQVDDAEMQDIIARENLQPLRADLETRPRVHYKNLWRYNRCFIAGTVSANINGQMECLAGARIQLRAGDKAIASLTTDIFGDFKFDQLENTRQPYDVIVDADGYLETRREALLDGNDSSVYLGEIQLQAKTDS